MLLNEVCKAFGTILAAVTAVYAVNSESARLNDRVRPNRKRQILGSLAIFGAIIALGGQALNAIDAVETAGKAASRFERILHQTERILEPVSLQDLAISVDFFAPLDDRQFDRWHARLNSYYEMALKQLQGTHLAGRVFKDSGHLATLIRFGPHAHLAVRSGSDLWPSETKTTERYAADMLNILVLSLTITHAPGALPADLHEPEMELMCGVGGRFDGRYPETLHLAGAQLTYVPERNRVSLAAGPIPLELAVRQSRIFAGVSDFVGATLTIEPDDERVLPFLSTADIRLHLGHGRQLITLDAGRKTRDKAVSYRLGRNRSDPLVSK